MTSNHAVNVHAPFLAGCSDVIRHNGCGHHLPPFAIMVVDIIYPPSLRIIKYHNYHLSSLWDVFWHVCQTITNGICNNIWVFSTCFVMYVLLTLPFLRYFFSFLFLGFCLEDPSPGPPPEPEKPPGRWSLDFTWPPTKERKYDERTNWTLWWCGGGHFSYR